MYIVHEILTNRIQALKRAAGYIVPGTIQVSQGETKFTTVHVVVTSTFTSNPSCTLYFQSVIPLLVKYTRLLSAGHLKWVVKWLNWSQECFIVCLFLFF